MGDHIARLAAHITSAEHDLVRAIGRFDADGEWSRQGAITCAEWLSWRIGLAPGAAREKVRVARALPKLPRIDEAFARAELSYSKVRALTRVATPENEADLIQSANGCTAAQLERFCRKLRKVQDVESDGPLHPEDIEARRRVSYHYTDEGRVRMTIELPADEGQRLIAAIDEGKDILFKDGERVSAETSAGDKPCLGVSAETLNPRPTRADGLMLMVESFLEDGPSDRKGAAPHELVVHIDADALNEKGDGAFLEDGGGVFVSRPTAMRLACDAGVVPMVEDASGKVLDVGRRTRSIPPAIRRALNHRDEHCCAFPGCTRTRFLHAHHVKHWSEGGRTSLTNLVLLCSRHHTFVHEGGYTVERSEDGRFDFVSPTGRRQKRAPDGVRMPSGAIERLAENQRALGRDIDELSLMPQLWNGDPVDYHWAVAQFVS